MAMANGEVVSPRLEGILYNIDIMCITNNKPFRNSPVPEHRLEHQQVDHLVLINKAYNVGACLIKALAYVPFISWFVTGSKPIIFGFA